MGGAKFSSSPGVGSSLFRLISGDTGMTILESSNGVDSYSVRGVSGINGVAPIPVMDDAGVESRSLTFPPKDLRGLSLGAKSENPLDPLPFGTADVDGVWA